MTGKSKKRGCTVRYVRTERSDTKEYNRTYVSSELRQDLRRAGDLWPMLALQIWSALHPDPAAEPTRPIADIRRYARYLVGLALAGHFRTPPRIAAVRRDQARAARRAAAAANRRAEPKAPPAERSVDGAAELNKIMSILDASPGVLRRIGG